MRLYSAAIIGAGPAGCAAAITLARKGLKVLLIEASEFSSDRTKMPPSRDRRLDNHTWKLLRNQSLISMAQAQGVEVWKACRIDTAIIEEKQLMGLTTERGTVRAYHILDASGQRQWLSQQLGCDQFAGPGWWLLGDAAATPNPAKPCGWLRASVHGLNAIMSGLQAARAIADCEHGKILEALAAQRYSQWLQTWLIQDPATQHSREHTTNRSPAFSRHLELSHKLAIPGS